MSLYSYSLLAEKYHDQIKETIDKNKTIIIKGPTGCGKSTYIPYILRDKKVAIIEPRRIAVTALYNILRTKIENVGFKMRFASNINEKTTMKIFTDGAFLNSIDSLDYDYIIVDEVHERSIRTDLILMLLKTNYKATLLLMSATLNTTSLEKFFNATTFNIPGEGFPVEVKYLDEPTNDYVTEAYMTVKKILKERLRDEKKDILIFLPGEDDINDCYKLFKKFPGIELIKIHSTMSDNDQMKIYENSELTRIILATNVCETSLTIPNVKYVIDSGLCKNKVFNGISYLGIQPISRDSSQQRQGRCNRQGPGLCYNLYTVSQTLSKATPEILSAELSSFILQLICLKKNILTINYINQPPINTVILALEFLIDKKCVVVFYKNNKIESLSDFSSVFKGDSEIFNFDLISKDIYFKATNYGKKLMYHPFDVHLSHFYDQCVSNGLGYYGSILVALISQENYNFVNCIDQKVTDIQYLIKLFLDYEESNNKIEFCKTRNVPIKGMEIASKISNRLNKSKNGDFDRLERIFSKCFEHNICSKAGNNQYFFERLATNIHIHPTSGFFKRSDNKIVFVNVFCGSKCYGRIIGKYYSI